MAQIFPTWTNKIPFYIAVAVPSVVIVVVVALWYYGSPRYLESGYRPIQPVKYSHKLHAGDLGIDCRYCHYTVEVSQEAVIPPTQVCMNCHTLILPESEKLLPVRESWATGEPIEWVRVHKVPQYAYFDHSIHVQRGVGCVSCHGNVANMEVVEQIEPLSMGWCLSCHRDPAPNLRPVDEMTNMKWVAPEDYEQEALRLIAEKQIAPPEDCQACHR